MFPLSPQWLAGKPRGLVLALSFAAICIIGAADYLTTYEFSFAIFYMAPILMATWVLGRPTGMVLAVASAGVSVATDLVGGVLYSSVVFHVWAGVMRTAFFAIAVGLLSALKAALERERALARHDPLTRLPNRTAFFERAEAEVVRLSRYGRPLTVGFVDCDNFKSVNDGAGHETGDKVLQAVAAALNATVRRTDVAARIGGDEFALLFPELGAKEAQEVITKLQARLLAAMAEQRWPVTFSIGVVTCTSAPKSFDALLAQADGLMYQVKNSGRNAVKFAEVGRAESTRATLPA